MKKLFLSAVFLLVCILSHAQGNSEKEDFFLPEAPGKVLADLGEIPGWVKDRVSDEEYRILKDASPWFKLDYTFLYRENNSDSRSKVFSRLKTTVAEIEKGTYVDSLGLGPLYGYVGFSMTQNIDRSREWELESYIRMADGVFHALPACREDCIQGKYGPLKRKVKTKPRIIRQNNVSLPIETWTHCL